LEGYLGKINRVKKKKLIISFSGGRTSGYMLWWIMNEWEDRHNWEIIVVFANTGKEVEGTLFFVDECSWEWNIPIVWIEGYPSDKGKGWAVNAKVVSYETAARKGEPFEAMIARLGIPSTEAPFCSPQLKREAIRSYAKQIGWKDYTVAIGMRLDEPARINRTTKKQKLIYPLVDLNPKIKIEIIIWWAQQTFDLNIPDEDGNCDGCYKKSFKKLVRIMVRKPQTFEWWEEMTNKYKSSNPRQGEEKLPTNFYRGNKSVNDIRELTKLSISELKQISMFEVLDGCQESCEAF